VLCCLCRAALFAAFDTVSRQLKRLPLKSLTTFVNDDALRPEVISDAGPQVLLS